MVLAESQAEVVETVRLCHAAGVPFMARGSGTSLSGGAVPIEDGIVIALNRLNRILRLDPVARIAVVEPGVVNLDVTAAGGAARPVLRARSRRASRSARSAATSRSTPAARTASATA